MMRRLSFFTAVGLVASTLSVAVAETFLVPSEYANIQAAITSATSGDTVLVAPGTHTGLGNRNIDYAGKDLVLRSESGPAVTIIDVAGSESDPARGFLLGTGLTNAVLDGFTIINGFMVEEQEPTRTESDALHDLSGAGIAVRNFNSVTIRNCIIRDCVTQFTGGGISVELGANARIENCVVSGCSAGIFGGGFTLETSADVTIINSVFTGNTSNSGAGAHFGSGAAQVEGSLFAGNWAANRGGGVYVALFAGVQMDRALIWNNCASEGPDVWIDPTTGVPDRGALAFACSLVDTSGVLDESGFVQFVTDNVFDDPLFCAPGDCQQAPTNAGDYGLNATSPALPENSPCGAAIGPTRAGCTSPVKGASWSDVKALYRGRRGGR